MSANDVTEDYIKRASGSFSLDIVERLDLSERGITSLGDITLCINLKELNISSNQLQDVRELGKLTLLTKLDLSSNSVTTLEGLGSLHNLESLSLQGNCVGAVDELQHLRGMSRLRSLYFQDLDGSRGNPVCSHPSYDLVVQRTLPELNSLDGERIQLRKASRVDILDQLVPETPPIELPPSKPWLESFDFGNPFSSDKNDASARIEALETATSTRFDQCRDLCSRADELLQTETAL